MTTKKFRLIDVILSVICVVFVAEAAAPVASIGNSQYFWWLLMIVAFLLPYGLISCELGTAYAGDGGLYDWIKKAYPNTRWAARASFYYWVNFPLWMASLAVMCPGLIGTALGTELGTLPSLALQLGFIWVVTLIALYPVCDSKGILNASAAIKILLALTLGGLGIYYVINNGFVNPMTPASFLPSFDLHSLSYISVIIFNFLGFEVVCTYADSMQNPRRQIPVSIILGGIVIAAIYLFSAFGIGAAVPVDEISPDSGLIDALVAITGRTGGWFISIAAILFLVTLFGNMISWSMGVNSTAAYAADRGDMPALFARRREKNDMPVGSALASGVVATIVCLAGAVMEYFLPDSSLFWSFFALNLVMLLLSYLPVFPAFLKLRKADPDTPRPFRVPGGKFVLPVIAYLPFIMIIAAILFTAVPFSFDAETLSYYLPITVGSLVAVLIGEILIAWRDDDRTQKQTQSTPRAKGGAYANKN
jgi:amino acid transporter